MSELRTFDSERIYWAVEQVEREAGDIDFRHLDEALFYLKSEADKEIEEMDDKIDELKERNDELQKATDSAWSKANKMYDELLHHKYKRCLDNAWWCTKLSLVYALNACTHRGWKIARYYDEKAELYRKWRQHWLELADKFKESK